MRLDVPAPLLVGFLLALARATAWIVVAPPFNTKAIPAQVKIGLAAALALFSAQSVADKGVPFDTAGLLVAVVGQAAAGLALGFLAFVLFSAVQGAGALIDLFGGFTVAPAYDPLSNAQSSVFGRFYNLLAVTLLFAIDGHLVLVRGFVSSFDAVTPGGGLGLSADALGRSLGTFLLAAVEIAAPLLAALFLAEAAMGLLARAAPQMNVFVLGFPVKILLTLMLVGLALPLLPDAVSGLVGQAMKLGG